MTMAITPEAVAAELAFRGVEDGEVELGELEPGVVELGAEVVAQTPAKNPPPPLERQVVGV